ncbi:MAG: SIS domain-containing protein [Candidatus Aenigmarchaeota archaeon]
MADVKRPWRKRSTKESSRPKIHLEQLMKDPKRKDYRETVIRGYLKDSIDCLNGMLKNDVGKIEKIVSELVKTYYEGKQVITMGNGGSAAIASHMASDFSKAWLGDGVMRMRSFSLVDNISLMTAWMNDAGYDQMFVGPLKTILNEGDVVIGISSSGNSKNILKAIAYANKKKALTIGLTGFDGGKLKDLAQINITVTSDSFKRVEDIHSLIGHTLKAAFVNEIKRDKTDK